jgi:hypothetical protein
MSIYRSARAYLSMTASVPPLRLHIRRNPDETSPGKVLPVVYRSVKALRAQEFNDGCRFLAANKLSEAATAFRQLLHALLLTVPTTPEDYTEVREVARCSGNLLLIPWCRCRNSLPSLVNTFWAPPSSLHGVNWFKKILLTFDEVLNWRPISLTAEYNPITSKSRCEMQ